MSSPRSSPTKLVLSDVWATLQPKQQSSTAGIGSSILDTALPEPRKQRRSSVHFLGERDRSSAPGILVQPHPCKPSEQPGQPLSPLGLPHNTSTSSPRSFSMASHLSPSPKPRSGPIPATTSPTADRGPRSSNAAGGPPMSPTSRALMDSSCRFTTGRFSTLIDSAVDPDGFYMSHQINSRLQRMQVEQELSTATTALEDSEDEQIAEAGRDYLADRLTGREAAAIVIQRAFRAHSRRRMLSRWQSSVGFVKTHIPDRVWNANRTVNALKSYSIKLLGVGEDEEEQEEEDGDYDETGSRDQAGDMASDTASVSGRTGPGRAMRMMKAFGSFFVPPASSTRRRVMDSTPQPFHAGRAIERSTTLPTHQAPPATLATLVLDPTYHAGAPDSPMGSPHASMPLRPSISGQGCPPSPLQYERYERRSMPGYGTLPGLPDPRGPRNRSLGASNTMFERSPLLPETPGRINAPPRHDAPPSPLGGACMRGNLVERSISSPGLELPPAQAKPRMVPAPPSPGLLSPRVNRHQSPARGWVVMRRESALGPALLASNIVGPSSNVITAKPGSLSVTTSPPPPPPAAVGARPRRLSLPSVFDTVPYYPDMHQHAQPSPLAAQTQGGCLPPPDGAGAGPSRPRMRAL